MKIIGRKYIPFDNSYSVNLTKPLKEIKGYEYAGKVVNRDYLAGTSGSNPIICEVLTNPFIATVIVSVNTVKEREMIIVKNLETGETNMVMYHPDGFKVKERIKAINRSNALNGNRLPEMKL